MNDASDRHETFVRLLNESHRRLLGYLMSLLGNRHDAEDVLQRASVTMWRRFETFEPGTDFMAWASTVAFYEAKNFQRVATRSRLRFDDELLSTLAVERLDDLRHLDVRLDALEHCVGKLDEANRKLVEAVYGEDADIAALAAQLGRAPQTLYNRLNVIRRVLADCVERRLESSRLAPRDAGVSTMTSRGARGLP
jgi:RNA polymerase sigma-70 factor (ECF subfamily)